MHDERAEEHEHEDIEVEMIHPFEMPLAAPINQRVHPEEAGPVDGFVKRVV